MFRNVQDKEGLPPSIAPLVGNKAREQDLTVRKMALEALFILTEKEVGRMWMVNGKAVSLCVFVCSLCFTES